MGRGSRGVESALVSRSHSRSVNTGVEEAEASRDAPGQELGDPSPEHAAFRSRLCAFLEEELGQRHDAERDATQLGGVTATYRRELMQRLGEEGFLGLGWPTEYGGGGRDLYYDLILVEEVEYHGGPPVEPSYLYVAFTLIAQGTEQQKRELLPRLRRGEISIIVGYSEAEAGSDLANLATMARPVDGGFLLSGVKVYQSYAATADYSLVAARTRPRGEKKHQGVSLLLVDMHADGVSVHQHETMAGFRHESVRFDEVFVPASAVVGTLDKAWPAVMAAIGYERAMLSASGAVDRLIDRHIGRLGDGPWDPVVADELIGCAIDARAAKLYSRSLARRMTSGEDLSDESGVAMLLKREVVRRLEVAGVDAAQFCAGAVPPVPGQYLEGDEESQRYLEDFVFEFSAGGFDITRNVIAQRILGMPR